MAAKKKKAYQRFEELTGKATGRPRSDPDRDPGSTGTVDSAAGDTVSVRLSPDVRRALVHQAKLDGCTPSELIEEALRRYLGLPAQGTTRSRRHALVRPALEGLEPLLMGARRPSDRSSTLVATNTGREVHPRCRLPLEPARSIWGGRRGG